MNHIIYALTCPKCGCPRYVGQTSKGVERYQEHLKSRKGDGSRYKKLWVASLRNQGLQPGFAVLAVLHGPEYLDAAETFWIAELRRRDMPLTNLTDGGHGTRGWKQTAETIAKRMVHFKGVPKTEEHKAKIAATLKGRPSPFKGVPMTPEHKASHAAARAIPPFQDQHGRIYKTIKEAADLWNIPKGNIVHCLKGRRKSVMGLRFSYVEDC